MKIITRLLIILHLIVGIGAVGGGLATIISPVRPFGVYMQPPVNSPFKDYLIPGIILFTILGLGSIFSAIMFYFKTKYQGYISSVFSWALVIWIVVQCYMINTVELLHIIFFIVGLVQAALSAVLLFKERLFPASTVLRLLNK